MQTPTREDFAKVRTAAERACLDAVYEYRKQRGGRHTDFWALNCSSFSPYEIEWCVQEDEQALWRVCVAKASPESWQLRGWLQLRIKALGVAEPVWVDLEW